MTAELIPFYLLALSFYLTVGWAVIHIFNIISDEVIPSWLILFWPVVMASGIGVVIWILIIDKKR